MSQFECQGHNVDLSYSTNVHPAETVAELISILDKHVGPVSRSAFGETPASVNLRLGMKQADEILDHGALPSTSTLSDEVLSAPPSDTCKALQEKLKQLDLNVTSINAFPIRDFHAPKIKEQVYSPPWTDGGRVQYTLKIAKALSHLMGERNYAPMSVPTGTFKGYIDSDEVKFQCAHFLTDMIRELARLERLTGKTIPLGLEPEPYTTAESIDEFLDYYQRFILAEARSKFPQQLGITVEAAEDLVRKFMTINLDLCHVALEFEDPVEDMKRLTAAGIQISGLHLSAALKLESPGQHPEALANLKAMDEPRYLHQVIARMADGTLAKFEDLPDLDNPRRMGSHKIEDMQELRCHFHIPLTTKFDGPLQSTRDNVGPAVRHALKEKLTTQFIVETYTWDVLNDLAQKGNNTAQGAVGNQDVNQGLAEELKWARQQMESKE